MTARDLWFDLMMDITPRGRKRRKRRRTGQEENEENLFPGGDKDVV